MRQCDYCGGRLESKGIRKLRRRYRCTKCRRNAGSIATLTDSEIKSLRMKDAGIGQLSLTQREEELLGLRRKKQPYSLLPQYDPKYLTKKLRRPNYRQTKSYKNWIEESARCSQRWSQPPDN